MIQILSNEKLTITINVDLDDFNKHGIHVFSIWTHLWFQNCSQSVIFFKYKIWLGQTWSNETLNDLKWKTFEYQDCTTHQDLYLLYIIFFNLIKC
jgi:hypothetical protein